MPLQSYEKKPKAQSNRLLFVTALVPTGRKQNGTVPDSHRESKNRPVIPRQGEACCEPEALLGARPVGRIAPPLSLRPTTGCGMGGVLGEDALILRAAQGAR